MAENGNGRMRRGMPRRGRSRYSCDEIALRLGSRRDRLVEIVPVELAAARGLTHHDRELAVDQAIDYLVTEYDVPIHSEEELERAFWKATVHRVRRIRAGREATVRGNWTRVDMSAADVEAGAGDPEEEAIRGAERAALREFSCVLTARERLVLAAKHQGRKVKGWRVLARELDLSVGEVRAAEASIKRKLDRFILVMSAGTLCAHREPLFAAFGTGVLSAEAERLALVHLEGCGACRIAYAARVRRLRSGQLERELAGLLPLPPAVETGRSPRAIWDALTEWITRPAAHDATLTSAQVGAATRGLGTVAAAKLAAVCIGGVSLVGGGVYCLHGPFAGRPEASPQAQAERPGKVRPARTATATPTATPTPKVASFERARATATPTPRPKPKPRPKPERPKSATSHERERAVSPAPPGAAPNGESEFGPVLAASSKEPAAPVASGGPEFP